MSTPTFEAQLAQVVANAIKRAVEPLAQRITALEPGAPAPTAYGLSDFAKDLAVDTKQFVRQMIAEATAPLEARIKELEAAPRGLKYLGAWRAEAPYHAAGDVVSDKGGMWVCMAATRGRPSESRDWTLAVKAGRDGKDAR
jgi:hypothetical protein